jgi:hypothetical protein
MKKRNGWHATKKAWAKAKLEELLAEEAQIRARHVPAADWRAVQGKMRALEAVQRDRLRFERIAMAA